MEKLIGVLVVLMLMLIVAGTITFNTWTLGGDEDDYEVICIGGMSIGEQTLPRKVF